MKREVIMMVASANDFGLESWNSGCACLLNHKESQFVGKFLVDESETNL